MVPRQWVIEMSSSLSKPYEQVPARMQCQSLSSTDTAMGSKRVRTAAEALLALLELS